MQNKTQQYDPCGLTAFPLQNPFSADSHFQAWPSLPLQALPERHSLRPEERHSQLSPAIHNDLNKLKLHPDEILQYFQAFCQQSLYTCFSGHQALQSVGNIR